MNGDSVTIYCLLRNDDSCALSDPVRERNILEVFEKHGVPQVWSVIPKTTEDPQNSSLNKYHWLEENTEMVSLIREYQVKGLIEVAQHGLTHQADTFSEEWATASAKKKHKDLAMFPRIRGLHGFSEFKALSADEKRARIISGKEYLEKLLNTRIETFVFPWNSFDRESLKAVKEAGIKRVLAGRKDFCSVKDMIVLYNSRENLWDIEKIRKDIEKPGRVKVFHFLYHSWLLTDEKIEALDRILAYLVEDKRVKFMTAEELEKIGPRIRKVARLNDMACRLGVLVDPYLDRLVTPAYYLFSWWDYWKRIIRGIAGVVFVKTLGPRRTCKRRI